MRRATSLYPGLIAACLALAPGAWAQGVSSSLSDVERAYAEVDYERTRTLAIAAIQQGKNDRGTTGELYLLWAIAAAALDQHEEARRAFSQALAANPELKLERNLSPKIRAPYLEARGAMSGAGGNLPLELTVQRRGRELELGLRDSLRVADSLTFSARAEASKAFTQWRFGPRPLRRVPLPGGSELQYFVQALDEHDNVLFELGTADDPRRLVLVSSDQPRTRATTLERDRTPLPYYVTSGAFAALGIAAGSVATLMYMRREDAARDWNGPGCEHPGMSRAQQCEAIDDRRRRAEYAAVGFAAAGGAMLLGSVVSLVLAPSPSRPSVTLDAGTRDVLLRVSTKQ